jgi:glutamate racemase
MRKNNEQTIAIGIFDSGVGGLTAVVQMTNNCRTNP